MRITNEVGEFISTPIPSDGWKWKKGSEEKKKKTENPLKLLQLETTNFEQKTNKIWKRKKKKKTRVNI